MTCPQCGNLTAYGWCADCEATEDAPARLESRDRGDRGMDEAVREARIQGLREGMEIAQDNAYAEPANSGDCPDINWDAAEAALNAAIAELREGKR